MDLRAKIATRVQQRPSRAVRADCYRALRPWFCANLPGPQPGAIYAVAVPLREAASGCGTKYMDPHGGRVLGFLAVFRSVVANHRLLQDPHPGIVTQRGTVAVDFRVHPDLDELRLLPVTHVFELP